MSGNPSDGSAGRPGGKSGNGIGGSLMLKPRSKDRLSVGRAKVGSAGSPGGKSGNGIGGSLIEKPMSIEKLSVGRASVGSDGSPGGKSGSVGKTNLQALNGALSALLEERRDEHHDREREGHGPLGRRRSGHASDAS